MLVFLERLWCSGRKREGQLISRGQGKQEPNLRQNGRVLSRAENVWRGAGLKLMTESSLGTTYVLEGKV